MPGRTDIRREEGQTMVEFAIVLPVLVLLLFGVVQFGIVFNNYITLTDGVRAGARKAAVSRMLGASAAEAAAKQAVYDSSKGLDASKLVPTASSTWARASDVEVCATYPYNIKLIGLTVTNGSLRSCTKERVE
jgi:Flp pilus assembly protein TadG